MFDALELAVDVAGAPLTVVAYLPRSILVRVPEHRALPAWAFELPIVVARCALPRQSVAALAVRDVVVVDRELTLGFGAGGFGLRAAPGAIEATVATGYLPRDMTALDAAHLELTVQLGQIRMPLRQIADLAVGQVIPLGCPLAGPFEVRAQGRLIGRGELIDVDGELGVRIVSVVQE